MSSFFPVAKKSFNSLQLNDVVIGPSKDGGYYLIGFKKESFNPLIFQDIKWGTENVFEDTMQIVKNSKSTINVLPEWYDIDSIDDLHELGSLPDSYRDWPYRIHLVIDGVEIENWMYPMSSFTDEYSSRISVHCTVPSFKLDVGTHTVTIFVHPYDREIIPYSWSFTINE